MTQMAVAALGPFKLYRHARLRRRCQALQWHPFNEFAAKARGRGHYAACCTTRASSRCIPHQRQARLRHDDRGTAPRREAAVPGLHHAAGLRRTVEYFPQIRRPLPVSMHCQDWVKDPSTKVGLRGRWPLGKGVVDWIPPSSRLRRSRLASRTTSSSWKRTRRCCRPACPT